MKKVLFGLFALSTVAFAGETNLYLRTGADLISEFSTFKMLDVLDVNKEENDGLGWEIAVEATKEIHPNLEVGVGLAYQNHNSPKSVSITGLMESEVPEFTSIPLYLTAKYKFNTADNLIPYVKADLGYSFNDCDGDWKMSTEIKNIEMPTDIKNGLYFGVGFGFEYNNFTMDLMYKINKGEVESDLDLSDVGGEKIKMESDFDYSRITLSFGYKFNLNF